MIYKVPRETQGSWVNMTFDPKGRLIVSDQYGKLYRVTLPPTSKVEEPKIEPIDAPIGEAQGLLWAFDSLYVVVNRGHKYESGLYRVRDTDGDDRLDKVEQLRKLNGGGEHGPHGIVLAPDGLSLYIVAGNATALTELSGSLVPRIWGEDNLLPRMVDGSGFMANEKAPGGYIARVTPDGQTWDLVSMGYRNPFDIAFNRDGELFTYDSDMEWDVKTPWYRPTRVLHATSGSEFGYRNGAGKWPPYTIDSLPPVVEVGPGSPTGIVFGYDARFPQKYREALYICDWSYGKLYAVHLTPTGSTYKGELEEFIAGTPLALTDIVVSPIDGAMYFAVGGRNTQSGLYRVVYEGPESTAPAIPIEKHETFQDRALRNELERFHGRREPKAVGAAWPYLGHPDRFVRFAARAAIEQQDPASWRERALAESSSPLATLNALLALTHASAADPSHRKPGESAPDPKLRDRILAALNRIEWDRLDHARRLDLLRVYQVVLNRFGQPDDATAARIVAKLDPHYPARSNALNTELIQILAYLQAPSAASKTVALLERAPTQEEQIELARALRVIKAGWNSQLQERYFSWFLKAEGYHGGNSFPGFMRTIRRDAEANLNPAERERLTKMLDAHRASPKTVAAAPERKFVKKWTLDELVPIVESGLKGRDYDQGRDLFASAKCFACHRFNNEGGGSGPELTGVSGRFSVRDLIESIVQPSKTISDQYQAVVIATNNGQIVTGRIVNLHGNVLTICPDMLDPGRMVNVARDQIDEMKPSTVSQMPEGLLDTLKANEVLDLVAYLLSRGDRNDPMFGPSETPRDSR